MFAYPWYFSLTLFFLLKIYEYSSLFFESSDYPVRKTKGIKSSCIFWIPKVFLYPCYICITLIFFIYKFSPVTFSFRLTTQEAQGAEHHYPEYIRTEPNYKGHMHLHYARNLVASFLSRFDYLSKRSKGTYVTLETFECIS